MERNDDSELRKLLREWKAPVTPESLEARVHRKRWSVASLLRSSIRLPVPVACFLLLLLAVLAWRSFERPAPLSQSAPSGLTFRELKPVSELRPRIIRRQHGRPN